MKNPMEEFKNRFKKCPSSEKEGIVNAISNITNIDKEVVYGMLLYIKNTHNLEFDGQESWLKDVFMPVYVTEYIGFWKLYEEHLENKIEKEIATTDDLRVCWEGLHSHLFASHPLILHMLITTTGYLKMDVQYRIEFVKNCKEIVELYNSISPSNANEAKYVKKNTKMMLIVILSIIFRQKNEEFSADFMDEVELLLEIFPLSGPIYLGLAGIHSKKSDEYAYRAFKENTLFVLRKLCYETYPDIEDFQSLAASATYSIINNFVDVFDMDCIPNAVLQQIIDCMNVALGMLEKHDMIYKRESNTNDFMFDISSGALLQYILSNLPSRMQELFTLLPFIHKQLQSDLCLPFVNNCTVLEQYNDLPLKVFAKNEHDLILGFTLDPLNFTLQQYSKGDFFPLLKLIDINGTCVRKNEVVWHANISIDVLLTPILIYGKLEDRIKIIDYYNNVLNNLPYSKKSSMIHQLDRYLANFAHPEETSLFIKVLLNTCHATKEIGLSHRSIDIVLQLFPLDPPLIQMFYKFDSISLMHAVFKYLSSNAYILSYFSEYHPYLPIHPDIILKCCFTLNDVTSDSDGDSRIVYSILYCTYIMQNKLNHEQSDYYKQVLLDSLDLNKLIVYCKSNLKNHEVQLPCCLILKHFKIYMTTDLEPINLVHCVDKNVQFLNPDLYDKIVKFYEKSTLEDLADCQIMLPKTMIVDLLQKLGKIEGDSFLLYIKYLTMLLRQSRHYKIDLIPYKSILEKVTEHLTRFEPEFEASAQPLHIFMQDPFILKQCLDISIVADFLTQVVNLIDIRDILLIIASRKVSFVNSNLMDVLFRSSSLTSAEIVRETGSLIAENQNLHTALLYFSNLSLLKKLQSIFELISEDLTNFAIQIDLQHDDNSMAIFGYVLNNIFLHLRSNAKFSNDFVNIPLKPLLWQSIYTSLNINLLHSFTIEDNLARKDSSKDSLLFRNSISNLYKVLLVSEIEEREVILEFVVQLAVRNTEYFLEYQKEDYYPYLILLKLLVSGNTKVNCDYLVDILLRSFEHFSEDLKRTTANILGLLNKHSTVPSHTDLRINNAHLISEIDREYHNLNILPQTSFDGNCEAVLGTLMKLKYSKSEKVVKILLQCKYKDSDPISYMLIRNLLYMYIINDAYLRKYYFGLLNGAYGLQELKSTFTKHSHDFQPELLSNCMGFGLIFELVKNCPDDCSIDFKKDFYFICKLICDYNIAMLQLTKNTSSLHDARIADVMQEYHEFTPIFESFQMSIELNTGLSPTESKLTPRRKKRRKQLEKSKWTVEQIFG
eukprot:NODE_9_length_64580_cov_1.431941.p1 type:complete len:1283 gc:universal NODE_9_length_64580_cov_1.431941:33711-29863(-)